MRISDWSSDVCSSDLGLAAEGPVAADPANDRPGADDAAHGVDGATDDVAAGLGHIAHRADHADGSAEGIGRDTGVGQRVGDPERNSQAETGRADGGTAVINEHPTCRLTHENKKTTRNT